MRTLGIVSASIDPDQIPAGWAFLDKFDGTGLPSSKWTAARQASGGSPNYPQMVGDVNNWPPSGGADEIMSPYDVQTYGGQLWIGTGAQYYGDTVVRCNVPFSFPSQTGTIELDAWIPFHHPLWGWPHIMVTEDPYSAPSSTYDNSHGPTPKRGFDLQLNRTQQFIAGSFYPRPRVFTYENYIETEVALTDTGAGTIVTTPHVMTHLVISFTGTHLTITANGATWVSNDWTLPSGFTKGWLSLCNHNHASIKYGPEIASPPRPDDVTYTYAIYDNIKFTGARNPLHLTSKVADNITDGIVADFGGGAFLYGYTIGWMVPTAALTLPNVRASPSAAWLVCSMYARASDITSSTRLVYKLNGGTSHQVPFYVQTVDDAGWTGMSLFSIPVTVSELVTGTNTVEFPALVSYSPAILPYVFNVQLVTAP